MPHGAAGLPVFIPIGPARATIIRYTLLARSLASCPVWMIEATLSRRTAEYARWVYLTIVMSGAAGLTLKRLL